MNANTGEVYDSIDDALKAGEVRSALVEIHGSRDQVDQISRAIKTANAVRAGNRKRAKAQRAARRQNRRRP